MTRLSVTCPLGYFPLLLYINSCNRRNNMFFLLQHGHLIDCYKLLSIHPPVSGKIYTCAVSNFTWSFQHFDISGFYNAPLAINLFIGAINKESIPRKHLNQPCNKQINFGTPGTFIKPTLIFKSQFMQQFEMY